MRSIFLCVYPGQDGQVPEYVTKLEAMGGLTVLHPNFDWSNENGKKVYDALGISIELPTHENMWCQMIARDSFTISVSDLVVYDVDLNVGTDFLYMAVAAKKPIIAVAENLTSPPLRYSGFIRKVIRPDCLAEEIASLP